MTLPPRLHYDDESDANRQKRLEDKLRLLNTRTPACSRWDCNETDPFVLTGQDPEILCYEHERIADGLNPVEADHRAGRNNDPATVLIPGNDHRYLSDLQQDWPIETLRNPHGDPLIRISATIRGWLDVLWRILMLLRRIPAALEDLSRKLVGEHGEQWWLVLGWAFA